jgi:hypothetical protein
MEANRVLLTLVLRDADLRIGAAAAERLCTSIGTPGHRDAPRSRRRRAGNAPHGWRGGAARDHRRLSGRDDHLRAQRALVNPRQGAVEQRIDEQAHAKTDRANGCGDCETGEGDRVGDIL